MRDGGVCDQGANSNFVAVKRRGERDASLVLRSIDINAPLGYVTQMKWNGVVESQSYLSDALRQLTEEERIHIIDTLAGNPVQGVLIKGTGGLRKVRIGFAGRGKRGGGRVVYWFHSIDYPIVLLAMFAKNEASDLTDAERKALRAVADRLIEDFGG